MKELLKTPPIFDGRNQYSPPAMKSMGFEYVCVGRG
jgi:UDPglucose 6-dehydrogenase